MKRLFIGGPAHGRVIDVGDNTWHWVVEATGVSTEHPGGYRILVTYQFGTYHLPRDRPWSPLVLLSVATPNGEDPVQGSDYIKRLAQEAGFRDTEGRPV